MAIAALALVMTVGLLAAQPGGGGWIGEPFGDGEAAVPDAWLPSGDAAFAGLLPGYAFAQSVNLSLIATDSIGDNSTLKLADARGIATFKLGNHIYAAVTSHSKHGVQILNITDPSAITAAGNIGDNSTLKLAGAWGIDTFESGDSTYAAVASYLDHGVQILNVTDPFNIIAAGSIDDHRTRELAGAQDIATFESSGSTYAAVASYLDHGVQILNVTDPFNITPAGSIGNTDTGEWGIATFKSDGSTYAAVALHIHGDVQILNITKSGIIAAGSIGDADDNALELAGAWGISTFKLDDDSTYAAVTSHSEHGVQLLDINNPLDITPAGSIGDNSTLKLKGAQGISTFESDGSTYAAVASYSEHGVQILDITNPPNITDAGSIGDNSTLKLKGAWGIATFESDGSTYAAVTSSVDSGVQILRLTDPPTVSEPTISVSYPSSGKSKRSVVPPAILIGSEGYPLGQVPEQFKIRADPSVPVQAVPAGGTFAFPLEINGRGYALQSLIPVNLADRYQLGWDIHGSGQPANFSPRTIIPQHVAAGETVHMRVSAYDNTDIIYFTVHLNLQGGDVSYLNSDVQVIYDSGTVRIVDPAGRLSSASVEMAADPDDPSKKAFALEITFAEPIGLTNMVIRTWNFDLAMTAVKIIDALDVGPAVADPEPAANLAVADPEPGTTGVLPPGVDPDLDGGTTTTTTTTDAAVDSEPGTPEAGGFSASEIRILKAWGGYSSEYADDAGFLDSFGFEGTSVPDYFRDIAKWFIRGELDRQTLVNALDYFEAAESMMMDPDPIVPESREDPGPVAAAAVDAPADEATFQDSDDFSESELRILRAWGVYPPEPVDYDDDDDPNAPIPPVNMDGTLDFPLSINGYGYLLTGTGNTLESQTVHVGDDVSISFAVYGSMPIADFTVYLNLHGPDDGYHDSDTYVTYNRGSVWITDPHNLIEHATVTIDTDGNMQVITFEITFADTMDLTHIVARTWDANRSILTMQVLDAFEVTESPP